jgi:hypothetical protein
MDLQKDFYISLNATDTDTVYNKECFTVSDQDWAQPLVISRLSLQGEIETNHGALLESIRASQVPEFLLHNIVYDAVITMKSADAIGSVPASPAVSPAAARHEGSSGSTTKSTDAINSVSSSPAVSPAAASLAVPPAAARHEDSSGSTIKSTDAIGSVPASPAVSPAAARHEGSSGSTITSIGGDGSDGSSSDISGRKRKLTRSSLVVESPTSLVVATSDLSGITTQDSDASTPDANAFHLDLSTAHEDESLSAMDVTEVTLAVVPAVTISAQNSNSKCVKCGQVVPSQVGVLVDDSSCQGFVCFGCQFTHDAEEEEEFQDSTEFDNDDVPADPFDDSHRKASFLQNENEVTFQNDEEEAKSDDEEEEKSDDEVDVVRLLI